jgi:hypothetical protein
MAGIGPVAGYRNWRCPMSLTPRPTLYLFLGRLLTRV